MHIQGPLWSEHPHPPHYAMNFPLPLNHPICCLHYQYPCPSSSVHLISSFQSLLVLSSMEKTQMGTALASSENFHDHFQCQQPAIGINYVGSQQHGKYKISQQCLPSTCCMSDTALGTCGIIDLNLGSVLLPNYVDI